jgi:hypothetical protein
MKNSGLNDRTHVEQSRRKHINGAHQTCNIHALTLPED